MDSFGTRLRRYRGERQWSLSDLSARTHYSPGHLSKVENDLRMPTRELAASCDAALGARGQLLAALGAGRTDDTARGTGGSAGSAPQAARPDEAALPALPATLSDGAAAPVVAALTTVLDGLRATAQSAGPGAVLESAAAQVRALRSMATHTRDPDSGHLLSLAGRYAEFVAWMCQEADDERSALSWARTTASLARHVGSPDIEANAVLRRSLLALYCDDGAATVELASAAADFTSSSATRVRALLRLAQGHALSGDDLRCRRALDDAFSLLSGTSYAAGHGSGHYGTRHVADPAAMARGWCLQVLGHHDEALGLLSAEARRIPAHAHRARARFEVRVALAALGTNDVDRACATLRDVLTVAPGLDSATLRTDLRGCVRALSRHRRHPAVAELLPVVTRQASRRAAA
ncbi:helix-turn-helix domain-containing protein [Streptomyces sp. NBC_00252]|uniref:helix-turn-helix transcriptional regulator n=1 Tax=Streptomyces sp. NBC_00252 TaxID=2975691 RepID=UPI002E2DE918|nr:helix-turn-helix transcriptional regulator [Streptomyces sp. NBC_00252]